MKRYRLVLARVNESAIQPRDLVALAERVTSRAPDIDVALTSRRRSDQWKLLPHVFRPTLTIGFGGLNQRRFLNGRILHCPLLPTSVDTSRPAMRRRVKTGHRAAPETGVV